MFKSRGYNTAAIGKWHLGWDWDPVMVPGAKMVNLSSTSNRKAYPPEAFDWSKPIPGGPLSQGFDYYFGDGTINFPPYAFIENDRIIEEPTLINQSTFKPLEGGGELRPGPMAESWDPYKVLPTITDKAVRWIGQQKKGQPFFMYFAFPSPHAPIVPNKEFHGKSKAGYYGDFVVETDAMAGRILKALEKGGFSDNTLVVFTADNGSENYAYERERTFGHWSSGSFRGVKRDLWEGGHHVPFVIRWPGVIDDGSVSHEIVSQVDLAATLADILGYELKKEEAIDSYSLLPLLKGAKYDKPLRLATVQNTYPDAYGLRQGDWMYINVGTGDSKNKEPEWFKQERGYSKDTTPGLLYNLKEDPSQHNNLFSKHPEQVARMMELLNRYIGGESCAPHAR